MFRFEILTFYLKLNVFFKWIVAFIEDQFDENAANIVKVDIYLTLLTHFKVFCLQAMLNHDILRINKEELGTPLLPDIIASKLDIEAGQVKEVFKTHCKILIVN